MRFSQARILNVDDSEGARYAKTRVLRLAGFHVDEAENGTDALAYVAEHKPDLVLLDVRLPDINGLEVCRRIKENPASATVLVLQTSAALIGPADKVRALEGGADNYLVAPVEAEELIANVHALLRLRHTEKELRESEERFRQITENISDVCWIFSPVEGRTLYVGPAYTTLWGRDAAELDNDYLAWLPAVHADDRARVEMAFARLLAGGDYNEEYRIVRADGSQRWVRDRAFPVLNAAGEAYRIARISSDISEKKRAEHLLQEADRRKDEFLATLAHELRNPLAPMRNALQLMQQTGVDAGTRERAQQIMSRQVDQMVHLVDELLDISRITSGKVELRRRVVDIAEILESATETAGPLISQRHHALETRVPAETLHVRADPMRLAQVIANLLNNAAKYTEPGGQLLLEAQADGDSVLIGISDNGIGIAPEMLQNIFRLFVQAEPDATPDHRRVVAGGLGVGLYLSRNLIELHGGTLEARSAGIGQGSRFVVRLPRVAGETADCTVEEHAHALEAGRSRRILVVDDNADCLESLAWVLRAYGHEVETADSGEAALECLPKSQAEVVIMDIGMPGLGGYETARRIRALEPPPACTLIALSGWGQEDDREQSRRAGFDHHLVKPVDPDLLGGLLAGLAPRPLAGAAG